MIIHARIYIFPVENPHGMANRAIAHLYKHLVELLLLLLHIWLRLMRDFPFFLPTTVA